ncbi:MAG: hypothetical protein HN790_03305 [Methylococcales bacterium]|jgi:hypothetical protein|nr:hypothetical protein [Methylococcales bacterium]
MLLLAGIKSITKTHEEGQFYCATCDSQQPFKHLKIREFGTLFFMPIFPMGTVDEYLECSSCFANYLPSYDTTEHHEQPCPEATSHRGMVRVLTFLLLGYGKTSERIKAIQAIYEELLGKPLSEDCILSETTLILQSSDDLTRIAKQIAPTISIENRAKILTAAHRFSDGCSDMTYEDTLRINQLASCFELRLPS